MRPTRVAPKPVAMQFDGCRCVLRATALTAYQVVRTTLDVRAGLPVLVHCGGGMTGRMLVALAAAMGARVIAVAGGRSEERLRGFGAAAGLNRESSWPRRPNG